jgi:hypothetical protein
MLARARGQRGRACTGSQADMRPSEGMRESGKRTAPRSVRPVMRESCTLMVSTCAAHPPVPDRATPATSCRQRASRERRRSAAQQRRADALTRASRRARFAAHASSAHAVGRAAPPPGPAPRARLPGRVLDLELELLVSDGRGVAPGVARVDSGRERACEAGFSTRNWNSWFQTGARWRPAWLVSSSRRLRTDCPPSATRAYGLLCQGKPQTGRLRASSSVTCARARARPQPAPRARCPAPVRARRRAHLPWEQMFPRRPVAQARGTTAARGAPQAPPAAPRAGLAPAAQSLQARAAARAGRFAGSGARGCGLGYRVCCAAARLQLAVEGVRQRHAARR